MASCSLILVQIKYFELVSQSDIKLQQMVARPNKGSENIEKARIEQEKKAGNKSKKLISCTSAGLSDF